MCVKRLFAGETERGHRVHEAARGGDRLREEIRGRRQTGTQRVDTKRRQRAEGQRGDLQKEEGKNRQRVRRGKEEERIRGVERNKMIEN